MGRRSMLGRGAAVLAVLAAGGAVVAGPAAAAPRPTCNGLAATIVGTDGKDRLVGTSRDDVIVGANGPDRIWGRGGDDVICGGAGRDLLLGQGGDDWIDGQRGYRFSSGDFLGDLLAGGPGDDHLIGNRADGQDLVTFEAAHRGVELDLVAGTATGQGADTLSGFDYLVMTPYDDEVATGDTLFLEISMLEGDDRVDAVFDDDELNDRVELGPGDDDAVVSGDGWVNGGRGADAIRTPLTSDIGIYIEGDQGRDTITLRQDGTVDAGPGPDHVEGSPFTDRIFTSRGDDVVVSGGGGDEIFDGPGSSTITGGDETLRLHAGGGDDLYDGAEAGIQLYLDALDSGSEVDLLAGTATGGTGSDQLINVWAVFGSPHDDVLLGSDSRNWLHGGAGDDVLDGRGGDDSIYGEAGQDSADGGDGSDFCEAEQLTSCERLR